MRASWSRALALLAAGCVPVAAAAADADTARRAMVRTYLQAHAGHLRSRQWMTRAMAVVGLAALDDPGAVEMLLEVAEKDASPAVRAFAWEALHAHNPSLSDAVRARWLRAGLVLLQRGVLRGDLRAGLLRLAAPAGPTRANRALFLRLLSTTSTQNPADFATLWALRETLAAWRDGPLAERLIAAMADLDSAWRAEFVLGELVEGVEPAWTDWKLGSAEMWRRARGRYAAWLRGAGLDRRGRRPGPYRGRSTLLPPPAVPDPADATWRRSLELPKFDLDRIEVTFAVDTTGSMSLAIYWLRQEVQRMLRALGTVGRRARMGLVFYRDRGEAYVVKPLRLTARAETLQAALDREIATGGGDEPEAVYEALAEAIGRQNWSADRAASRSVVLLGDAPPHAADMEKVRSLVTDAAGKGFRVFCVKALTGSAGGDLAAFDRIAEWGGGSSIAVRFRVSGAEAAGGQDVLTVAMPYWGGMGAPAALATIPPAGRLPNRLVAEVLAAAVGREYRGRVEPFVNVLMELAAVAVPERQQPFGPWQPQQPAPLRPRRPQ